MRVLHIFTNPHLTNGASVFEFEISKLLRQSDIYFDYLITEPATPAEERRYKEQGSHLFRLPIDNDHGLIVREAKVNKAYYEFFKSHNYNIVYADTENPLRSIHLWMARLAGVKVRVVHSHNSNMQTTSRLSGILARILRSFFRFSATDYFACSDLAAEWLFPTAVYKKKRYKLLKNGIDLEKFRFDPAIRERRRYELGAGENQLLIGTVARFAEQKNHLFMLEIFQKIVKTLPDAKLLFIGEGKLEQEIKTLAKEKGIFDQIIFFGTTDCVNEYLSAMDAYLMPSLFEGLPITGIEAQAAGLPCFMSDTITKEAGVTKQAYYLSLDKPADFWAKQILDNTQKKSRLNVSEDIERAGFSITQTKEFLRMFYAEKERIK